MGKKILGVLSKGFSYGPADLGSSTKLHSPGEVKKWKGGG